MKREFFMFLMKVVTIMVLICGHLMTLGSKFLYAENDNLVVNPGFEFDQDKDGIPDGWDGWYWEVAKTTESQWTSGPDWGRDDPARPKSTFQIDREVYRTGFSSIKIVNSAGGHIGYRQIVKLGITESKGKSKYTLGGWVKTKNIEDVTMILIHYFDRGVKEIGEDSLSIKGTNDWTELKKTITLPDDTCRIEMVCFTKANRSLDSTVWFDDIILRGTEEGENREPQESSTVEKKVYYCQFVEHDLTIDGDLKDWSDIKPILLNKKEKVEMATWQGVDDLSVKAYLARNNDYLYFAADVTDDIFSQPYVNEDIWKGDCIQLAFDPLGDKTAGSYGPDDYEYNFAFTSKGSVVYRSTAAYGRSRPGEAKDIKLKVKSKDRTIIYEMAIPWRDLEPLVPAGRCGFNFLVNDNDGRGRKGWFEWTPGSIGARKDPSSFGELVFTSSEDDMSAGLKSYLNKDSNAYGDNEKANIRLSVLSKENIDCLNIKFKVSSGDKTIQEEERQIKTERGFNNFDFVWDSGFYPSGNYLVTAAVENVQGITIDRTEIIISKFSTQEMLKTMQNLRNECVVIRGLIDRAYKAGIDVSYQRLTARVVEDYIEYSKQYLDRKLYQDAQESLDYLVKLSQRDIKELETVLRDPSKQKRVPEHNMMNLAIRNGEFYSGDKPVLLVGPLQWEAGCGMTTEPDVRKLREYGFNSMKFSILMFRPFKDRELNISDSFKYDTADCGGKGAIKAVLDRAKENNLAVSVLLETHNPPEVKWLYEPDDFVIKDAWEDPWGAGKGNSFMPFQIDHPEFRKIVKRFYEEVIAIVKDKPALFSYILLNEPVYKDWNDYSDSAIEHFKNWVRAKYEDIARLNRTWNTTYENFEQVTPPPKHVATDPSLQEVTQAIWYDWLTFNQDRVTGLVKWMRERIRELDQKTPIHVKNIGFADERFGIDHEAAARLSEINGTDGELEPFNDFLKSLAPDKPMFNSEEHPPVKESLPKTRTVMWQNYIHGLSGSAFWVWGFYIDDRRAREDVYFTCARPERIETIGRTALDLRRLTDYIVEFHKVKPEVAVLFSWPSVSRNKTYWDEMFKAYEALQYLDVPIGFVTEKQIEEGNLKSYKLLIAPQTIRVKDVTYARIKEYVQRSGHLFVLGDSLKYDEYGIPRELSDFVNKDHCGEGRIISLKVSPGIKEYATLFEGMLDSAKVLRDIRVFCLDGKNAWKVEARMITMSDNRKVINIVNYNENKVKVCIKTKFKINSIKDLITCKSSDTSGIIDLEPFNPMLLEVK